MSLYVQNRNLLNKNGTLGTSVGCCCDPPVPPPPDLCCCEGNSTREVTSAGDCDGTTSPVPDPPVDIEDISIVVDWDGLTVVCEEPFFSASASEAVDFSCDRGGGSEPFDATQRTLTANFFPGNTRFGNTGCWYFSSNVTGAFIGTTPSNGFDASSSRTVTPFVADCKKEVEVELSAAASWCDDNPYGPISVTLIFAP